VPSQIGNETVRPSLESAPFFICIITVSFAQGPKLQGSVPVSVE